ncbi:acyltransferase [Rhizobium sp. Pop5]|uniref:acyltransferase family protein n=1 Tax=Rhizobium sp. Pop5 TaxID=1223565 RepID=UPI002474C355|nr:acyltransferase [Rhizobium sp. Pop5]
MRAIALLSVFYSHFWGENSDLGHVGVRFFFVLSGFLITNILLATKERDDRATGIIVFFIRRAARIWPPYFLLLAFCGFAAGALQLRMMHQSLPWHALFLSNFWYATHGPDPWALRHLWTLAVEEQFYLIWPFVVLALPARFFLKLCGVLVLGVVPYRLIALSMGKVELGLALPFDSVDALAAGAALSFLSTKGWSMPRWLVSLSIPVGVAGLVTLAAFETGDFIEWVVIETALLLPLTAIVALASKGQCLKILANRAISGLGRISYGAYLYHLPIWAVFISLGIDVSRGPRTMLVVGASSVLTAFVSWVVVERPVMAWSKRLTNRVPA